jgi:glycosyltransferase involved in cell wall biosynthesis
LLVVGAAGRREPPPPDGVEVTGFVDDLGTVWDSARLLIAPITIGGGVRVKLLEAASRGVPVVGTRAAVGSTSAYLPLTGSDDDDMLISRCAEFLTDGRAALAAGHDLWEANADCWRSGRLAHAVAEWLGR